MLLASANALSSSSSDENETVYVLTLARLIQHGTKFDDIPLAAICDLCRRHGDPADLQNEHTLRKHLTGRNHKKRLRDELARLDRALSTDDSSSSSSSSKGSASGYPSGPFRGDFKEQTQARHNDSSRTKGPFTPTYNSLTSPARRDSVVTNFPCANLNCQAKCAAEGREVRTKCGKCGLTQAVPRK